MKYPKLPLLFAAVAALALSSAAFGADTKDQMIGKITGSPPNATNAQAGKPPYAIAAHALVGKDNTWDGALVFQGATWNQFTTRFRFADPTANRTITFPNSSGTVLFTDIDDWVFEGTTEDGYESTISATDPTADQTYKIPNVAAGTYSLFMSTLATNGLDAANSVWGASNGLVFEGATADAFETTITPTDPTADRTVTVHNASGTVTLAQASTTTALTADDQAVTPGSNTRLQLTSDNATATNRTFTLSATGAITGQIYVIIGPATNQCEIAATGIQKLSATWSPTTSDTLTLLFDGTNFLELARSNN
jgi:hypothetical protein